MEVFVARQPIFTKDKKVYGYELLYRSGKDKNVASFTDGDQATIDVISNTFSVIGLENLTSGKRAFINFTQKMLNDEIPLLLPRASVVIEILESVVPDENIIACCQKLKERGYILALDDVAAIKDILPLMNYIDIVKVDFMKMKPQDWQRIPGIINGTGNFDLKFLAEKVETNEEYQVAAECGYTYFQGYFFSKPMIISGQMLSPYKLNYLRILREVYHNGADVDRIEALIKQDIPLSYKLLKLINSVAFGMNTQITSVKYALVLLGLNEFMKWLTIVSMSSMGSDKPNELVALSLIRARFAELLADDFQIGAYKSDAFLMGMFSMIDALVDRPLSEVLGELPISMDVKDALLGMQNHFTRLYNFVVNYEHGEWNKVSEDIRDFNLDEGKISDDYLDAIKWVGEIFK